MAIEVRRLGFTYPGNETPTLENLSFSVQPGEIYGFLGPSGAGKTTTQRILYGLATGYSGSVRIDGTEIADWGRGVYARIGIGFETPGLYLKLTGRENLEFAQALHEASRRVRSTAHTTSVPVHSIDDAARRLGLADAIDDRVETYSKGMRMRLSFIRAVLHGPSFLFLDEPTAGLDPSWARCIKDWILELRTAGVVTFLTTHSMELADELCDTVGFLVDGAMVVQDSPAALKQRHGKPGVLVRGLTSQGHAVEIEASYDELLRSSLAELCDFTELRRITNREVSLEQVFLKVTGRHLHEALEPPEAKAAVRQSSSAGRPK